MRVLGVVPARGGSRRIPRKNLQSVGGMTLVERAIEHARGAEWIDDLLVSTDCGEISLTARRAGAIVRMRPDPIVGDGEMAPVLLDALRCAEHDNGVSYATVVCIQPTSPLRTSKDIDETIWQWVEPTNMGNHLCAVSVDALTGKRNGAVYVTPPRFIREGLVFRGPPEDAEYPMPHERSLDINEWADLEEARRILGS